jgi:tRNA(fMet)-specific endonuclease VapC
MSLYVLDTDTLTLYRYGHGPVLKQVALHAGSDVVITVLSVEEQLTGWYSLLRRSKQPAHNAFAYDKLADTVCFLGGWKILPYTVSAMNRYKQLQAQRLNVGAVDLKIAAVTLENGGTIVTRNQRDFGRVPNLTIVDWSV